MSLSLSQQHLSAPQASFALGGRTGANNGLVLDYTGNSDNVGPAAFLNSVRRWPVQTLAGGAGVCAHRWAFCNWFQQPGELDTTGGDITVTASVQQTFGGTAPVQLTFNGRPSVAIAPGATVWSDWCFLALASAQDCEVRTAASIGTGVKLYTSRLGLSSLGERLSGYQNTQADATMAASAYGGLATSADNWAYGPSAAAGRTSAAVAPHTLAIVGDSIMQGAGDNAPGGSQPTGDAQGYYGWAERAVQNAYGVINVSQSNKKASDFNASSKRAMSLVAGRCTHALAELGYNDIGDNPSLATLQGRLQAMWASLAGAGMKVIANTFPAQTTSTDGWTTLSGQTTVGYWAPGGVATQINDWLRAGAGGNANLLGVLDVADAMMSARDSQKWRVDLGSGTGDGVHPSQIVTQAVAAAVRPALLAMLGR